MSKKRKNILFIMFDQLRFDYLSCAGHKTMDTPHMDRIASMGVRFAKTYVQSPICGSSRMSFYTGRYPQSHGATWNGFPLRVGEMTLGDHLRPLGMSTWLVGKTHMKADTPGMERLGIAKDGVIGARVAECGFDVWERDDGLWAEGPDGFYDERRSPYNEYLKSKGYEAENPWHDYANSGLSEDGELASGWLLFNSDKPANIREEDSETPWLTSRVIDFMEAQKGKEPWLCHLSYIKPHWPYIVPQPYHQMYGHNAIQEPQRSDQERVDPHPVLEQFQQNLLGQAFAKDDVREVVIPAYMGLIKQCDDQMGRLFAHLEETGEMENTIIVLTSDHGDYLGDHWLGEKGFLHDQSVRVPLIIYDPSPEADASRGRVVEELVESIDLAATFVEMAGGKVPTHVLEGRSLMPFLRGETPEWRDYAVAEYDYSPTPMATKLGLNSDDARLFMIADHRWKFIHAEGGFRPMLFDQDADPLELNDLGGSEAHGEVLDQMYERLGHWGLRVSQRTALSEEALEAMKPRSRRRGILLGMTDGSEYPDDLRVKYDARPAKQNYLKE